MGVGRTGRVRAGWDEPFARLPELLSVVGADARLRAGVNRLAGFLDVLILDPLPLRRAGGNQPVVAGFQSYVSNHPLNSLRIQIG